MLAISRSPNPGGHPLWHLLVVAAGAITVFLAIKAKEYWSAKIEPQRAHRRAQHDARSGTRTIELQSRRPAVFAIALCSMASAAIHASVSAEHFQEAFLFGAFFLAASTAQSAWGILVLYRPNRILLIAGAAGNTGIIALWTITRTIGLPIGPEPWHPETIGTRDIISTLCEGALVVAATVLLIRNPTFKSSDVIEQRLHTLNQEHPTLAQTS